MISKTIGLIGVHYFQTHPYNYIGIEDVSGIKMNVSPAHPCKMSKRNSIKSRIANLNAALTVRLSYDQVLGAPNFELYLE